MIAAPLPCFTTRRPMARLFFSMIFFVAVCVQFSLALAQDSTTAERSTVLKEDTVSQKIATSQKIAASQKADSVIDQIDALPKIKINGDIASELVAGVDRFLLERIQANEVARPKRWLKEFDAANDKAAFFEGKRESLKRMIGVRDARVKTRGPQLLTTVHRSAVVGEAKSFTVKAIRIPVLPEMNLEGLLLEPKRDKPVGCFVVVPDADQTPEELCGLVGKLAADRQTAAQLAANGFRVIVPTIISRKMERRRGRANLTHREFLYRPAFELGRHLIGYEVQKVLACIDWFRKDFPCDQIGIWGYGEGALLATYAAAIDERAETIVLNGFPGNVQNTWQEPVSRNVFGLAAEFGDAELLQLMRGRNVIQVCSAEVPRVKLPSEGGAPGKLEPVPAKRYEEVKAAWTEYELAFSPVHDRSLKSYSQVPNATSVWPLISEISFNSGEPFEIQLLSEIDIDAQVQIDSQQRMQSQLEEIVRLNERLLTESESVRKNFMKDVDASSLEKYQESIEKYREIFAEDVIGKFNLELKRANPRSRKYCETEKYVGYELVMDVFDDVIAYGIILIPKGMKSGEKRPVVVCQHGLEGRPQDIVQGDHRAYHDFAAKLAENGLITFSPQNLYIFQDRFRTLQRKANPLGKTLFSVIVPQHQQIVNWLKTLPCVDAKRIAFYGLSYGGKSAMRIPPLVPDYCLSICSADFNEWVWKNASTRSPYSYVWTGEYEIFEFDLGSTFNYAEMAALIAPRPFMVERGHFDGVSSDERVAYEFAKVRHLYQARLGIGDRTEIEFFVGPHTINGKGTFRFLSKHLNWPIRVQ